MGISKQLMTFFKINTVFIRFPTSQPFAFHKSDMPSSLVTRFFFDNEAGKLAGSLPQSCEAIRPAHWTRVHFLYASWIRPCPPRSFLTP